MSDILARVIVGQAKGSRVLCKADLKGGVADQHVMECPAAPPHVVPGFCGPDPCQTPHA